MGARRIEEVAASRRLQIAAKSVRHQKELIETLRSAQRRSRETPTPRESALILEVERGLQEDLARYPELTDEALLRKLAPTRWERLVDGLRRR
jgi:hypothetical protein